MSAPVPRNGKQSQSNLQARKLDDRFRSLRETGGMYFGAGGFFFFSFVRCYVLVSTSAAGVIPHRIKRERHAASRAAAP